MAFGSCGSSGGMSMSLGMGSPMPAMLNGSVTVVARNGTVFSGPLSTCTATGVGSLGEQGWGDAVGLIICVCCTQLHVCPPTAFLWHACSAAVTGMRKHKHDQTVQSMTHRIRRVKY
jgi:hypothetical protein